MTHKESLASHLLELRSRLIRLLICFGFLALIGIPFSSDIYTFAASPLLEILPSGSSMIATQVTSPLMAPLKLVFFSALLITMPYLFYEMWMFMSPGLYKKEKNFFFFLQKSNLMANIVTLLNLEPILGFILEFKSIPIYLHGHTVSAMCFNMGHLVRNEEEAELEV